MSLIILLLLTGQGLAAQFDSTAYKLAQTIRVSSMHERIYALSSREFEGRETGTEGIAKAADYIANQLASAGISKFPGDDNYFHEVAFSTIRWGNIELTIQGQKQTHLRDFLSIPMSFPHNVVSMDISSLLFLGYGIDDPAYSDYEGVDVKGKHILIYQLEPRDPNGIYKITGTKQPSAWSRDVMDKIALAQAKGAASVWIIDSQFKDHVVEFKKYFTMRDHVMGTPEEILSNHIPHFLIPISNDQKLAGKKYKKLKKLKSKIDKSGKSYRTTIPVDLRWGGTHENEVLQGMNVLGFIEGTDPRLKDELVIVSAHYDHLGKRGEDIFYGADDNASGTSAVIEIAEAFNEAKRLGVGPKRSVICMLMTGEEMGLLGSQYYVERPLYPLDRTIANVNIDMIGRMDEKHPDSNYTYVIGSDRLSTDLHKINESVNQVYTKLYLDYTFNADDDPNRFYYRSDHYNFAKNGIPAIFYFSGVHEDYHRPTDTPDKIMFGKAVKIAQLAFYTTWELANREERIKVDVTGRN